jgi:hypothetical protein
MANIPVGHNLPTLSGLSPTGSTGSKQRNFINKTKNLRTSGIPRSRFFLSTDSSISVTVTMPSASTAPACVHSRAESNHINAVGIATTTAAFNSYPPRQALHLAWPDLQA